ncbi:SusC/RagA family TonB-linked outer membrane protein [Sphingobacterium sp. 2149]|uniref:SusC/RagA family TonB-linked outer membrane protein n=1 Tax=Sphingobacterium sp. 2149 TaxID=2817763 RepID=UPI001AE9A23E|nr:SusC/RagA family TonB-linked outer membrane protein [Sphingobacterium sp. 2149]MDR6735406.1 TonB-linked SusC/RagA family outer membrane protein [Sphingobacterium sp. 2149]
MRVLLTALFTSVLFFMGKAQEKIWVQGTIVSAKDGRELVGASIRNKTLHTQAASSLQGKFAIQVGNHKDSLMISCVGFVDRTVAAEFFEKHKVLALNAKEIYLEEAIVSTGYQTLKANEVTGAIDVVDNKMLSQQVGTNILDRLNNMTTVIRFDNQPIQNADLQKLNISVRGLSTINGNLDPLIVLDGFIYEGDISNIDPNNIESVSILKDAAASAIWGARAGNGVIVMTSKKGAFSKEQKTKVTLSNTIILKENSDLNKIYQPQNADFIAVEKYLFEKGYYDSELLYQPYLAQSPVIDLLDRRKRNLISPADSARGIAKLMGQNGRQNYMDAFYNVPFVNQHALNISGGGTRNSYGFGIGYTGNKSELDAFDRKINIQLSNSFRPTENIQLDLHVLYTNQDSRNGKPAFSSLSYGSMQAPYLQFLNENGTEIPFEKEYRASYLKENYTSGYLPWDYYPLSEYKYAKDRRQNNEWFSSLNLKYKVLPYLHLNVGGQIQQQRTENNELNTLESYEARKWINEFTIIGTGTTATKYNIPLGGIKRYSAAEGRSYTLRGQIDFNKSIGRHLLVGILGGEVRENRSNTNSYTAYGYNELPMSSTSVDFVTRFPTLPDDGMRRIPGAPQFFKNVNRFVSLYTNISDRFMDRYGLSMSLRKDGANIFGASTNDKWSPLWSIGGSWDIHKEAFFNLSLFDYLKLRTTYGTSGNVDLRRSPDPIAYIGSATYTSYPVYQISTLNDPLLKWERVVTTNFGLDFSVRKGRLSGRIDYYIKKGKDLYGLSEYDYTAWGLQGTVVKNLAGMRGQGFDIDLNSKNISGKVNWDTRMILSLNRNKTTQYYNLQNSVTSFLSSGNTITPIVGKPLNALAAYKWMGLNEFGEGQGLLDGQLSTNYTAIRNQANASPEGNESIVYFGSSKPQVFGNIINTLAWKSLIFSFNVSFKGDYYVRRPVTSYFSLFANGTAYPDFDQRWQQPGDEKHTQVPGMKYPIKSMSDAFYQYADINVYKGDHLRLEYISLTWQGKYTVGNRAFNMGLSANAANLGVLWRANKIGIDPEFPYRLSPPKTFSIGLKIDY